MRKIGILIIAAASMLANAQNKIDLSGDWQFALDRDGTFSPSQKMTEKVILPGTTDTNKKETRCPTEARQPICPGNIPTKGKHGIDVR